VSSPEGTFKFLSCSGSELAACFIEIDWEYGRGWVMVRGDRKGGVMGKGF
jgi:hypothetical protein